MEGGVIPCRSQQKAHEQARKQTIPWLSPEQRSNSNQNRIVEGHFSWLHMLNLGDGWIWYTSLASSIITLYLGEDMKQCSATKPSSVHMFQGTFSKYCLSICLPISFWSRCFALAPINVQNLIVKVMDVNITVKYWSLGTKSKRVYIITSTMIYFLY